MRRLDPLPEPLQCSVSGCSKSIHVCREAYMEPPVHNFQPQRQTTALALQALEMQVYSSSQRLEPKLELELVLVPEVWLERADRCTS